MRQWLIKWITRILFQIFGRRDITAEDVHEPEDRVVTSPEQEVVEDDVADFPKLPPCEEVVRDPVVVPPEFIPHEEVAKASYVSIRMTVEAIRKGAIGFKEYSVTRRGQERWLLTLAQAGRARAFLQEQRTRHARERRNSLTPPERMLTDVYLSVEGEIGRGVQFPVSPDSAEEAIHHVDQVLLQKEMSAALKILTERERRVIWLRFGFEDGWIYTLEEIGKEFGVTRERIRQDEAKALRKLRSRPDILRKLKAFFE